MKSENLKQNIEEGSALIAEYMGFKYYPYNEEQKKQGLKFGWLKTQNPGILELKSLDKWFLARRTKELRYYNSWEWLMPVVEKLRYEVDKLDIIYEKNAYDEDLVYLKNNYYHSTYMVYRNEKPGNLEYFPTKFPNLKSALFFTIVDYLKYLERKKK